MRAVVVTVLTAALGLLLAAPASAAPATYTNGDEWGLWSVVHDVTLNCDSGDRMVGFRIGHGARFIRKIKPTRTGVTLTLRAGDPDVYDSAVSARVTCWDIA